MDLPNVNKIFADTATNILTELFKNAMRISVKTWKWFRGESEAHDFFGQAAEKYSKKFVELHNRLQIIGMTEPVPLTDIFVRVNILKKITSWQWFTEEKMRAWEDGFRNRKGFGEIDKESVNGIEVANQKPHLMLMGLPGAGKTTFLNYIGIQASQGKLDHKRIPVFISLKKLCDSNQPLLDSIAMEFDTCNFPATEHFITHQLDKGSLLLLLDGLDEIGKNAINKIYDDIDHFYKKYSQNQFIISCRTAAYNQYFPGLTVVELADFNQEQTTNFINNWFANDIQKAQACKNKLFSKENKSILELAKTPLVLSLLCVFFNESMSFPQNRAELYKDGLYALLEKWDASKNVPRDEIYRCLTTRRKIEMLSQTAYQAFEQERYFLKQDNLEKQFIEFIENLPESRAENLAPDGKAILKAIEIQHGLLVERTHYTYSFLHLTFQEYFTARYIVDNDDKKGTLQGLLEHITDPRWREVFLLCAEMGFDVQSG